MQLTLWTYEGPPHVGAMRIATAMEKLHYVLHAPQGDTYADLLFTMIERLKKRPPVTYTTFQARDLGGDTAGIFKTAVKDAFERFNPQAMIVGASCTAELIQDDPGGLAKALDLPVPVVPLELPAYQKKENWGAAETFYRIVRSLAGAHALPPGSKRPARDPDVRPSCNILGATALGFRHRDDVKEIAGLLRDLGIDVNMVAPQGATPEDITSIHTADFNVVLYPEVAETAARWMERSFRPALYEDGADRRWRHKRFHQGSRRAGRGRPDAGSGRRAVAHAVVRAVRRFKLSDGQTRVCLRRRLARYRGGPGGE